MNNQKRFTARMLVWLLLFSLCGNTFGSESTLASSGTDSEAKTVSSADKTAEMTAIEEALKLSGMNTEWTYNDSANTWVLSAVPAVTRACALPS